MKKASVFLDIDNTLLDFDRAERLALIKTFDGLGISWDEDMLKRYNAINISKWELLELGVLTRAQVLSGRFEQLFKERGIVGDGEQTQRIYEDHLSQGHFFMPGAVELLEALHEKYDLYLASNGNAHTQDGRLKSAGIGRYCKDIFISEQIGAEKPGRVYFERCFSRIDGFDPSRAIMVGDSLTSDIRGGINAGIKTCWFNFRRRPAREDIKPDYTVYALEEIPPLLEKVFL